MLFLSSGLAAVVAAGLAVGFGNALTSTNGLVLPTWLATAAVAVPVGAAAVLRRLPALDSKRVAKFTGRTGVAAVTTIAVALLLIYESYGTLRGTLSLGEIGSGVAERETWRSFWELLTSPRDYWDAAEAHWREAAVAAAYGSVPLAGIYVFQGFLGRAIIAARERAGVALRVPLAWFRSDDAPTPSQVVD